MGSLPKSLNSSRRSIRKIWHKELLYFRSNHPLFIIAFIALFAGFYNLWWRNLPEIPLDTGKSTVSNIKVFDNLRFTKHKFVRILICIPDTVVDYRFSTVTDAIHLTHLDYPDVEFIKDIGEAKKKLSSGHIDILILFTTLIETGKKIDYNIISSAGDLNKHYCIICDNRRKLSWGHAIEAQTVVNRFLYWLIKARGFATRKPHFQLSNVYIEEEEVDHLFAKRQTDLFVAWLILLPICARLIDSWNDDRKSGFYKVLLTLGTRRLDYFTAKFQFWYGISLIISCAVWAVNISVVHGSFTSTYLPFMVIYVACIFAFAIFLATLFPDSPFFAKFVGLLLMAAGEFGFGQVYHGITFFQLSVRFFGKSTFDAAWDDTVALVCMSVNFVIMLLLSLYLDTYFFSYTSEPLSLYFPLERAYWMPTPRSPQIDKFHVNQILSPPKPESKGTANEGSKNRPIEVKKDEMVGNPLVVLYGVCKRISNHWKVNQLSITIKYGEIVTLYGHSGCGNEEILEIISGELKAEYGEVMREKSLRELMISQTTDVPDVNYLSVKEYLTMVCKFRGTSLTNQFLTEILSELDLEKVKSRSLDLLSTTQKERLRVAAAFVGCPDVVLIDSPTRESPPQWKYMILNFIEKHKEKRSIVISSYDAEETEAVSDRIVLLSEGYVILNGSVETYRQSMNSVFEIRLWPMSSFSDENIQGIVEVMTLGDEKMKEDVKYFETPNGKLRFLIPTVYRRCMQMLFADLESNSQRYQIAYFEISKPNIQDVYTNACYEPRQYEPLANYHQLKEYYAKQQPISRTKHFFKNLFRILKDRQFLYQVASIFALFLVLGLLTTLSYQKTHTHYTHEISLTAHDYPTTIYCEDCVHEKAPDVTYVAKLVTNELKENNAFLFWRNNTHLADLELIAISRGDDTFTMVIQNFAIAQLINKLTGNYPKITPILESEQFRASSTTNGFSMIFNDVSKNQAAMILSESYPLMYMLGVFQTFIYTLSVLLPLRLVSVNMRPESMLFPWPRYLYFGLIFGANLAIFMILSIILTCLLLAMGNFETDTTGCFFRFLGAWIMVYVSTLPLIYTLVFSVNNATAVIPTVMAVSSLLVNLPNMVSSFSAENAISLETLLRFVSWTCMISPPTALQVLAAFLNAGEFHAENTGTIFALTMFCCAQSWILIAFIVSVFQPGFARIRQMWFLASTSIWSSFTRGTTLTPGACLRNLTVFPKKQASNKPEKKPSEDVEELQEHSGIEPKSSEGSDKEQRPQGGQEPKENIYEGVGKTPQKEGADKDDKGDRKDDKKPLPPSKDFLAGNENLPDRRRFKEPLSHITRIEEELIREMAKMRRWDDKQEVPIDNSALYLLGDQSALKSSLLRTIAEINCKEQIAYVPFVECLPTIYTPQELLENVAACHGFEVTKEHVNYLLDAFGMLNFAATPIRLLNDADRRILMLLTKLVIKPSIIILDQLDMFLPHAKMMTVWSLCSRLRTDGVAVIFTSRHSSFAEHTATSCAHMNKCQFLRTIPPSSIKADLGYTVLEIVPKPHVDIVNLKGIFNAAFQTATYLPSMDSRFSVLLPHDDIDSMNKIMANVRAVNMMILRYSLRSLNFEEYISMSYQ